MLSRSLCSTRGGPRGEAAAAPRTRWHERRRVARKNASWRGENEVVAGGKRVRGRSTGHLGSPGLMISLGSGRTNSRRFGGVVVTPPQLRFVPIPEIRPGRSLVEYLLGSLRKAEAERLAQ